MLEVLFIAHVLSSSLSSSGGKEAVRQGDGEVLLCSGETPQSVLQKEGNASARGKLPDS